MLSSRDRRTLAAALVSCAGMLLGANAAEVVDKPTEAEIQYIETHIDMPNDAGPLDNYIRFYYVGEDKQQRTIEAGYVSRSDIEPSKLPVNPIVVVQGYDDVPAWYDASCAAVRISYTPQRSTKVEARCDPSLELFTPPVVPGWMYALVPLAPFAALFYFGIARGLRAFRARRVRT